MRQSDNLFSRSLALHRILFAASLIAGANALAATPTVQSSVVEGQQQGVRQGEMQQRSVPAERYSRRVEAAFDDVMEDLKFAVSEKNYRITGVNTIGKAISDRQQEPFKLSSVVHFCNVQAAKQILEINSDYLLHMPCRISLQETDDGFVLVEALLIPLTDPALTNLIREVNQMLREIVDFTVGEW